MKFFFSFRNTYNRSFAILIKSVLKRNKEMNKADIRYKWKHLTYKIKRQTFFLPSYCVALFIVQNNSQDLVKLVIDFTLQRDSLL